MLNDATPEIVNAFRAALPEGVVRDVEQRYLEEPRDRLTGRAGAVLTPGSVEEVSAVMRLASEHRVGIVPYGGGTGLVGGQLATEGPVPLVLSLERMKAVRGVWPEEGVMTVEAGAILQEVQGVAESHGRLFPLSLGSEGSARIGGLLGTNAGGVNVLRYGNARELCLGVEAVLADGRVMRGLKRLRKDNTGYDLRNLLIGSEGTLGVITAASLRLFPRPENRAAAVLVVESPAAALGLLGKAQGLAGPALSAFELIAGQGPKFLAEHVPQVRLPWSEVPDWCVLIELGCSAGQDADALMEALFSEAYEAGLVRDGVVAASEGQRAEFWAMRESLPEGNRRVGSVISNDISLPLSAVPEFITRAGEAIGKAGDFRINCFGHLGDGNLHYNVFPAAGKRREDYPADSYEVLKDVINQLLAEMEGSFSAEHGLGRAKVDDLAKWGDPVRIEMMRAIKKTLDPLGILNPGAIFGQNFP
ncbi:FAD-binding oxidoreductase [Oceanicola sp. 502str15]|uniref:FAD-binding oxidoreductase n=1 Tax=Oceanicola sp. 502str15 TaxID=2696061 RepID=UPI002094E934|nr:FAD-binding oxidoreductase [Oceanicola sp. 502str15]MCO6383088.1 FAD-binding protein [Oceanicola sp. 502str15]